MYTYLNQVIRENDDEHLIFFEKSTIGIIVNFIKYLLLSYYIFF